MERDEIPKTLCRSGCGFYGSSATDGLCSVCFKEVLKKKCVPAQAAAPSLASMNASSSAAAACLADQLAAAAPAVLSAASLLDPQLPAVGNASAAEAPAIPEETQPSPIAADSQAPEERKPTKPKSRCDTCKKKVGLTGFDCRCGGLFCAVHRYSDKHDCSYNYREQGAAEIRKNNPQITGQKINKI